MKNVLQILKKTFCLVAGLLLTISLLPVGLVTAATGPTTFDHIDIRSEASFKYKVNGIERTVNINFQSNNGENLQNIELYRRNANGTSTPIAVNGDWQRVGHGSSDWEYRVPGIYQRYYSENNQTIGNEVKYFIKYILNVEIAGRNETLVFESDDYSYSSSNNLCPGSGTARGIDIKLVGKNLEDYFSPALEIVKKVEKSNLAGAFNFVVSNGKTVQINTNYSDGVNSGSAIIGGLIAGQSYTIYENDSSGYKIKEVKINNEVVTANNGRYTFVADPGGGTTTIEFINTPVTFVTVEKRWGDGAPLMRSVEIALLKNGSNTGDILTLTADNNWKGNFINLDKYDENGQEIIYTVVETKIDGKALTNKALVVYKDDHSIAGRYDSMVNGTVITNVWTPATEVEDAVTTNLTIQKVNTEGEFLRGAKFKLTKDDETREVILDEGEFTFEGLAEGVYILKEIEAPVDYVLSNEITKIEIIRERQFVSADEATLVNTYHNEFIITASGANNLNNRVLAIENELETINLKVAKIWNDEHKTAHSVKVQLYRDGREVDGKILELNADNNWEGTFANLRKSENGIEIDYTINEVFVFGSENGFIVYGTEQTENGEKKEIKGRWNVEANNNGREWIIKNTWVAASYMFVGAPTFKIQKVDQDGKPLRMAGVKFKVVGDNGYEKDFVTNGDGEIEVKNLPADINVWDDGYIYEVFEIESAPGYGTARGMARVEISSDKGSLTDVNGLMNVFTKEFNFIALGSDDYSWEGANTLIVKNYRLLETEEEKPCLDGCGEIKTLPTTPRTGDLANDSIEQNGDDSYAQSINMAWTALAMAIVGIILMGVARFLKR